MQFLHPNMQENCTLLVRSREKMLVWELFFQKFCVIKIKQFQAEIIVFFSSPSSEKENDCNIFSSITAWFCLKIFLAEFQMSCEMHPGLLITVTKDTQRFNAVFAELGVMAVRLSQWSYSTSLAPLEQQQFQNRRYLHCKHFPNLSTSPPF